MHFIEMGVRVSKREYDRFKFMLTAKNIPTEVKVLSHIDEIVQVEDSVIGKRTVADMRSGYCHVYPGAFASEN